MYSLGPPSNCESLITNYDLVHFFKEKTEIFLLLREIETCLRFIVCESLSKRRLMEALRSIRRKDGPSPPCIDDLTFDELRQLICRNWKPLKKCFLEKEKIDRQLIKIRDLRNRVFHLRDRVKLQRCFILKNCINNLIEKLFSFIKSNPELEQEFKQHLGKKEIYKALKDIIENSQNILLILDETKGFESIFACKKLWF